MDLISLDLWLNHHSRHCTARSKRRTVPGKGQNRSSMRDSLISFTACARDRKGTDILIFWRTALNKRWCGKEWHEKNWFQKRWIKPYNCTKQRDLSNKPRSSHRKHSYCHCWSLPNSGSVVNHPCLVLCEMIHVQTHLVEVAPSMQLLLWNCVCVGCVVLTQSQS